MIATQLLLVSFALLGAPQSDDPQLWDYLRWFPLKHGNEWTYREASSKSIVTMKLALVTGPDYYYALQGFPVFEPAKIRYGKGEHILAWRNNDWVPLFNLSAPGNTSLVFGNDFKVTKAFDWEDVGSPTVGTSFKDCRRYSFEYFSPTGPGAVTDLWLAFDVGPVRWKTKSGAVYTLESAVIRGFRLGTIPFSVVESGAKTGYPISDPKPAMRKNRVLLIRTKAQWHAFYWKHKPTGVPPQIDFSKQCIAVVLLGNRSTTGYSADVSLVRWNYPKNSATIVVKEQKPGPGVDVKKTQTRPYAIVVLEAKPPRLGREWKVVTYAPNP